MGWHGLRVVEQLLEDGC